MSNPWKKLKEEIKYENNWISVNEHQVINPSGNEGIYGIVEVKNWAVGMIPVDNDGNTYLVKQYRYPLDKWTLEIPEGGGNKDHTLLETAMRELKEETGIMAKRWKEICRIQTSNCITDEMGFVFLAEELEFGEAEPDEDEEIEVIKVSLDEAISMARNGVIEDSLSVAGLLSLSELSR